MIPSKIENLIIKYINRTPTVSDLDTLSKWIKIPANKELFKDYVKTHYAINFSINDPDTTDLLKYLLQEIRKDKSVFYRHRMKSIIKYAAAVVIFVGLAYLNQQGNFDKKTLIIDSESITLQLEDGNIEIINEDGNKKIIDKKGNEVGSQQGNQLKYNNYSDSNELVYNKLTVPHGKKFQIVLSDGTKVHLNSGTTLNYPVKFLKGTDREVQLLSGEAYFDVAENPENPFIVASSNVNVRVLGTQFNITSYPEDSSVSTVLVKGSVSLYEIGSEYDSFESTVLTPGLRANWSKIDNSVLIDEVDTEIYTGWIEGKLIFRNTPFRIIRKKLERHYNVTIINNNAVLDDNTYTALFNVETIEKVLQTLNESYKIDYEIINSKIIIN